MFFPFSGTEKITVLVTNGSNNNSTIDFLSKFHVVNNVPELIDNVQ